MLFLNWSLLLFLPLSFYMHCVTLIWLLLSNLLFWNNYSFTRSFENITEATGTQNPPGVTSYLISVQAESQDWTPYSICAQFISLYHGSGLLQPPPNRDTELFHHREDTPHASRLLSHPPSCLTPAPVLTITHLFFFLIYMGSHSMFLFDPAFSFITLSLRFQIHTRFASLKVSPLFSIE